MALAAAPAPREALLRARQGAVGDRHTVGPPNLPLAMGLEPSRHQKTLQPSVTIRWGNGHPASATRGCRCFGALSKFVEAKNSLARRGATQSSPPQGSPRLE